MVSVPGVAFPSRQPDRKGWGASHHLRILLDGFSSYLNTRQQLIVVSSDAMWNAVKLEQPGTISSPLSHPLTDTARQWRSAHAQASWEVSKQPLWLCSTWLNQLEQSVVRAASHGTGIVRFSRRRAVLSIFGDSRATGCKVPLCKGAPGQHLFKRGTSLCRITAKPALLLSETGRHEHRGRLDQER